MIVHDPLHLRLLTHNIRYATSAPFEGEEKWEVRAPRIVNELRFTTAHCAESFICLQEVLHGQLIDIARGLNHEREPKWDYIGVGRDDGKTAGEYSPIFFQKAVWKVERWKTVWLSETPSIPSKSWDAASTRILTVGLFQHCHSRKRLVAMNTHLDDQGSKSRMEAAKLILAEVSAISNQGQLPVYLAGDFNSQPSDEAYLTVTSDTSPMKDLRNQISQEGQYGHYHTFTGFGSDEPTRIDFLFTNSRVYHWLVEGYGVLENQFDDKVFSSDHRAVVGDVALY